MLLFYLITSSQEKFHTNVVYQYLLDTTWKFWSALLRFQRRSLILLCEELLTAMVILMLVECFIKLDQHPSFSIEEIKPSILFFISGNLIQLPIIFLNIVSTVHDTMPPKMYYICNYLSQVDTLKHVTLSYCKKLGLHSAELTINKRGYSPGGGGEVVFFSNSLKIVKPIQWLDPGKVRCFMCILAKISNSLIVLLNYF